MSRLWILSLVLVVQDPRPQEPQVERSKKAQVARPGDQPQGVPKPQIQLKVVGAQAIQIQARKRILLEVRAVEAAPDADQDGQNMAMAVGVNLNDLALASQNFDLWVFADERTDDQRKALLDEKLSDRIRAVEKAGPISDEAWRKLRLAGNGDIKRYLDKVEAARAEFEKSRQDFNAGRMALGQLEPLADAYRDGPFGPGSLFEKTLGKARRDSKPAQPAEK